MNDHLFDPYNTSTLKAVKTEKIADAWQRNWRNDEAQYEDIKVGSRDLFFIKGINYVVSAHEGVPSFAHPIQMEGGMLLDIRPYSNYDKTSKTITIKDETRYTLDRIRSVITWSSLMHEMWEDFSTFSKLPALIYANAFYQMITSKNHLEVEDGDIIKVLSLMFYINRFHDKDYFADEENQQKTIKRYAKDLRINPTLMFKLMERVSGLKTLDDLCKAISDNTGSIRMDGLNPGTILSLSINFWYSGPGGLDLTSVSVEHPPTFIAMCYTAIESYNYKKTTIGRLADMYKKEHAQFLDYIKNNIVNDNL